LPFVETVKSLARGYGYMVVIPGREKTFVVTVVMLSWDVNFLDGQKFIILKFTELFILSFNWDQESLNSGTLNWNFTKAQLGVITAAAETIIHIK
jgi:hypothetical protein